jgi:D-alanyl-D-alanine endopeptidase (penicillin-binding protein 7)
MLTADMPGVWGTGPTDVGAVGFGVPAGNADAATRKKATSVKRLTKMPVKASRLEPTRPSFGQLQGLRGTQDPLELKSSVALVLDQDTGEVLVDKNSDAVLPIASLSKLMTAMVVVASGHALDEV